MTGTMLNAGAVVRRESQAATITSGTGSIPSPHFRCRPKLTLEILKGDCTSRQRAVETQQAFIGSDEDCELRLLHPAIPSVAAVVRVLEEGVWIEPCRQLRALKINGAETRGSWLKDGDEIEIAPFLLKAHLGLQGNPAALELPSTSKSLAAIAEPVRWIENDQPRTDDLGHLDPADLSAAELLNQIESDMLLVERDEKLRREGEDTLLRAIRARQAALAVGRDSSAPEHASGRISIRFHAESESESSEALTPHFQNSKNDSDLGQLLADLQTTLEKLGDLSDLIPSTPELETVLHKLQTFDQLTPTQDPRAIA